MKAPFKKATDNFADKAIIGRGGFGTEFEGKIRRCSVAVKRLTEVTSVNFIARNYILFIA